MKLFLLLTATVSILLSGCDSTILPTSDEGTSYTITTIAGSGAEDDDGKLATEAFLTSPRGVAVDGHGNLYIADTENHRVRRIDAESGIIITIAGSGEEGYGGDEGPADGGKAQLADRSGRR